MDFVPITWAVRGLVALSAVCYAAHVWLVWRRIRAVRSFGLTAPAPRHRRRVRVRADVHTHHGEPFLIRD